MIYYDIKFGGLVVYPKWFAGIDTTVMHILVGTTGREGFLSDSQLQGYIRGHKY